MRKGKVIDSIDLLAGFEHLQIQEQKAIFLTVIDTLGGYPKPTKKGDTIPATPQDLGAYLFVSNVRNACKLGELELIDISTAYQTAQTNLEHALTLLQQ